VRQNRAAIGVGGLGGSSGLFLDCPKSSQAACAGRHRACGAPVGCGLAACQCSSASEAAYLRVDRSCCPACPAFWLHPAPLNFADSLMCWNRRCPSLRVHTCSLDIPIFPRRNSVRSGSKHSGCCSSAPAQAALSRPARTQSYLQFSSLRQPHLVTPMWRTSLCRRSSRSASHSLRPN
jgi:hypothetical protein